METGMVWRFLKLDIYPACLKKKVLIWKDKRKKKKDKRKKKKDICTPNVHYTIIYNWQDMEIQVSQQMNG